MLKFLEHLFRKKKSMPQLKDMKLGKRPPVIDPRTLKLARYLDHSKLPPLVPEVSWVTKVPIWPMMLNDQLGDCVAAAAGHAVEQWTTYADSKAIVPTDQQILKTYEDVGGYVPGNPATDNGMDMLTYLKYWRGTGVGGHKIGAFVGVNPQSMAEVMQAIRLFGNCYIGLALPLTAQSQNGYWAMASNWTQDPNAAPGSWGGHCVLVAAASQTGGSTVITWGQRWKMSWNFMHNYCDEAYAMLSPDWLTSRGMSPVGDGLPGFNAAQLQADLAAVASA